MKAARKPMAHHPNEVSFDLATSVADDGVICIPRAGVMKKWACLGVSGSGKTYCAGAMVEGFLDLQAQVVVMDTMGNWFGLRIDADGKTPSPYQIPIFGGDHADLPLLPEHGEELAHAAAASRSSMILDISDFTEGQIKKFVIAFATTLLRAKKKAPSPILVVWEECQDIIPQNVMGEDARMVGAVQRLIKRGRNYGVGTLLISQRPAAVNKGCLNMCETLFAFRTPAPLDRKAIKEWVDGKGDPERVAELMKEVPKLQTGTALMYSVAYDRCELVTIGAKTTFNASSEPDFDDEVATRKLAPIDLTELKQRLDQVVIEAENTDVDKLRAKIAALEAKLADARTATSDAPSADHLSLQLKHSDLTHAYNALLFEYRDLRRTCDRTHKDLSLVMSRSEPKLFDTGGVTAADQVRAAMNGRTHSGPRPITDAEVEIKIDELQRIANRSLAGPARPRPTNGLSPMERNFLTALAQFGASSKGRLRAITGYASSGPVSATFAKLLKQGWASDDSGGGLFVITPVGRKVLGDYEQLPSGNALRMKLMGPDSNLAIMEKTILDNACKAYPSQISKRAARGAYASSGPVSAAFAKLAAYGYLEKHGNGFVKAWAGLFG